jgi:uncharacterized protein (DUF58 family)
MEQTTNHWRRHFDPETVEPLRGLRLPSPHRSEGRLAGHRRNPRIGGSADFAQHRQYVPGDDIRLLDWKIFGRTDRYFLKQREDESNLVCHLVVDASGSMTYRSAAADYDKLEFSRRIASAIAFIALHNRDGVSLTSFAAEPRQVLTAARVSPSSIRVVAEALDRVEPGVETRLAPVLTTLAARLPRRGLLIVISDFLDDPQAIAEGIRRIARREHQFVLIQVSDPAEEQLPWQSPVRLLGLEGEAALDLDPANIRRAYRENRQTHFSSLQEIARQVGATWLSMQTDRPLAPALRGWLAPP